MNLLDSLTRILLGTLIAVFVLAFVLCGNYLGAAAVLVGGVYVCGLFQKI